MGGGHPPQLLDHHHHDYLCQHKGQAVSHGLCKLQPRDTQQRRQNQDGRYKKQSLLADGGEGGTEAVADGLGQHIPDDGIRLKGQKTTLHFQRQCADAYHLRILFAEQPHDGGGNGEHDNAHYEKKNKGYTAAEEIGFQHPVIAPRAEVKAARSEERRGGKEC